jgi:hypothetical protein
VEKLTTRFINAKKEFQDSKASGKSVENLYDIIYFLKNIKERNFEENYVLAEIYSLVGENIFASKIIEESLVNAKGKEIEKLMSIQNRIENQQNNWNVKIYRDLRDSKLIKEPLKLNTEDFIIEKDIDNSYCIKISKRINNIIILNKNIKNCTGFNDCYIFSSKEPDEDLLTELIDYIKWLGQIKNELLVFYKNSNFKHKINNVGQKWFDGLNIFDFSIEIDEVNSFQTEILLHDYLQNNFGFRLEIEDKILKSIEYDPNL